MKKTIPNTDGPLSEAQPETKPQPDIRPFWERYTILEDGTRVPPEMDPVPEDVVEEFADEELDKPLTSRAFLIGCAMVADAISLISPGPKHFIREARYRFAMDWARGKMPVEDHISYDD
jgi:hypothetical protein